MEDKKHEWVTERLLFVAHEGTVGSSAAAIIMDGHCLPIAVSHGSDAREAGIAALWEAECGDVEAFFGALGVANVHPGMGDADPLIGGLFVYEVTYGAYHGDPGNAFAVGDDPDDDDDGWGHLKAGEIRRPSGVEMLRLSQSDPPWDGGVVL